MIRIWNGLMWLRTETSSKLLKTRQSTFLFNNQPDTLTIQMYSVIKHYMFRASSLPMLSFITE